MCSKSNPVFLNTNTVALMCMERLNICDPGNNVYCWGSVMLNKRMIRNGILYEILRQDGKAVEQSLGGSSLEEMQAS